MSRRYLRNCCFVVDLKMGSILIALFGAFCWLFYVVTAFGKSGYYGGYNWIDSFTFGLYGIAMTICVVGAYGAWKTDIMLVRLFAMFSWIDLIFNVIFWIPGVVRFFVDRLYRWCFSDNCIENYLSIVIVVGMALLKIYFAWVVWSYYRSLSPGNGYTSLEQEDPDVHLDIDPVEGLHAEAT
ncbi:hypothetical protein K493DRAFT_93191, partial [Basidiobolus meristosporus CBS 931.73]